MKMEMGLGMYPQVFYTGFLTVITECLTPKHMLPDMAILIE